MRVIGILCCILLISYTSRKLYRMAQIRGWVAGATVSTHVITKKWSAVAVNSVEDRNYYIKWADPAHPVYDQRMVNIDHDLWSSLRVGDTVEVVWIGAKDGPYVRNGIFADNGNFVFDIVLILLMVGVIVYLIIKERRADYVADNGL